MLEERKTYEDGWTDTEKVPGEHETPVIVGTEPTERGMYNVGVTYEQIKEKTGIPTPTTDDSGKVLKVDAEGKWELSTDAEGTVVIANPTLAGTEADLTGLQVGTTKYKVEQPINVVANPVLAGTESALTGLEVGTTKYKVPQGMEVVELTGSSGTLTDAQYELVHGNNCIILLNEGYYYKFGTFGTLNRIWYVKPSPIVSSGLSTELYFDSITFDYKSWSKTKQTGLSANADTGNVIGTLTSLNFGNNKYTIGSEVLAYEGTSLLPTDVVFENWTLHRAIKEGNILWLVVSGNIVNNSSSSYTFSATSPFIKFVLPSQISALIYRYDGSTCDENYSTVTYQSNVMSASGCYGSYPRAFILKSTTANELLLALVAQAGDTITAGGNSGIFVRIPIFLDIGTVQQ